MSCPIRPCKGEGRRSFFEKVRGWHDPRARGAERTSGRAPPEAALRFADRLLPLDTAWKAAFPVSGRNNLRPNLPLHHPQAEEAGGGGGA